MVSNPSLRVMDAMFLQFSKQEPPVLRMLAGNTTDVMLALSLKPLSAIEVTL